MLITSGSDVRFPLPSPFALGVIGFLFCGYLATLGYVGYQLHVIRAVQEQIDAYVIQVPCESNHATGANAVKFQGVKRLTPKQ